MVHLKKFVDLVEEYMTAATDLYNYGAELQSEDSIMDEEFRNKTDKVHLIYGNFMELVEEDEKMELWVKLINAIDRLCYVNILTGFFDGRRGVACRSLDLDAIEDPKDAFDYLKEIVDTELNSRKFCEQRAFYRTRIDEIVEELVRC